MEASTEQGEKRGIGPLGWVGVGCGGIVLAVVGGISIFWMKFGGEIREMKAEAEKNPARAAALGFVKVGGGKFEMAAEDELGRRYTVREVGTKKLMTFYWSSKTNALEMVEGDFSAIPSNEDGNTAAPKLEEPKQPEKGPEKGPEKAE
jgi:hypothetical protein